MPNLMSVRNGQALPLKDLPILDYAQFRAAIVESTQRSLRLTALFGDQQANGTIRVYAALADHAQSLLHLLAADLPGDSFPSITRDCPQAHNFERELAEQWGVIPLGHPWLKPLRYHHSYRPGHDAWSRMVGQEILPCVTEHFRVEGAEIHEVAVGPVHAGVIEPGSFRFQCHGEHVFHLEIHLGYQYRGIERALMGGPNKRTLHYMETVAGDTSIGHATAYCQAVEGLANCKPSNYANSIRGIALELERLACHTGDLGALADDVGFLPTANFCGRLRGDFLNASGTLCGNRFGRSMVRPGGVGFDITTEMAGLLGDRLKAALRDVGGAAQLLRNSQSVQSRFENTGTVSRADAIALGIVGVALRATGVEQDVRADFSTGIYSHLRIPVSTSPSGDVYARFDVRVLEIESSGKFVLEQLHTLHPEPIRVDVGPLAKDAIVVSLVEGWRGEICHVALTNEQGMFRRYKIVDPSFHNWIGLAMALRDQQITDFPLCNKSFNLSYCGHDL